MKKIILDVACGGRMFWFDKTRADTLYVDRRRVKPVIVGRGKNARLFSCQPDRVMDFRKLKLKSNQFNLVVFDPPHYKSLGKKSWMGILKKKTWREDLRKGFSECFRVLKPKGVLIFKWNEHDIRVREILALSSVEPLFGHMSGKNQKTHWIAFMKN